MKLELTLNYLVATTEPNQSWRAAYLTAGNVKLDSITKKIYWIYQREWRPVLTDQSPELSMKYSHNVHAPGVASRCDGGCISSRTCSAVVKSNLYIEILLFALRRREESNLL